METASSTFSESLSSADIVECIRVSLKVYGLNDTMQYFKYMEHLLSHLPCWGELKMKSFELFSEERERQEQQELARLRASSPNIYQLLPSAQSGVNMDVGVNSPGNMIANTINNQTNQNEQQHGE